MKKSRIVFWTLFSLIITIYFIWVPQATTICGTSMFPTLDNDSIVVTIKRCYNIDRFDIITFEDIDTDRHLIKRVMGLPGETICYIGGFFIVNGKIVQEDFSRQQTRVLIRVITLKSDEYFMMGDNRDNSFDSRHFGPIKANKIRSKMLFKIR